MNDSNSSDRNPETIAVKKELPGRLGEARGVFHSFVAFFKRGTGTRRSSLFGRRALGGAVRPELLLRPSAEEPPFRGELLSLDQLQEQARILAEKHKIARRRSSHRLIARLDENLRVLREYNQRTLLVESKRHVTPAAEWLLDNFYLIEEQIHMAHRHLPPGYSRELPHLASGPSRGLPRVYDMAVHLIAHFDSRLDEKHLMGFVSGYQTVRKLRMGELWAIPIMLRLALIENLRRFAVMLSKERRERDAAVYWSDRMLEVVEKQPFDLIVAVAEMARANVPLTRAFVAEFWRRLREKASALQLAFNWVEQQLMRDGLTMESLAQDESRSQAANQVSVGNCILSLRFLDAMDWREFVETLSVVEQTLRSDPTDVYGDMDFNTRDSYRHVVEHVARYSKLSEEEVALRAIRLAELHRDSADRAQRAHVGFYLIDKGLPQLEEAAEMRPPLGERIGKFFRRHALAAYLSGIGWMIALMAGPFAYQIYLWGAGGIVLGVLVALSVVSISHPAISLVNWIAMLLARARPLPRLDFSQWVPPDFCTLVVVPTMLNSLEEVDALVEALEVRYLGNRDESIYFGLLADFNDALQQVMPEDEALLERVRQAILSLNEKYKMDRTGIFFLFHRLRRWNEKEGVWMGYERKRGKLAELNALLRGRPDHSFVNVCGDVSIFPRVKYVITLDTDTQLPRDAARQLIGTMAHPLNWPRFSGDVERVAEGYGILQPRLTISLPSAMRSWYTRLLSDEPGLDPYTRVTSDVYQDLFHEGAFCGKGIYHVDVFDRAVGGRFPDNRILSHDLLESAYARSGLVSDIQLYEESPSHYIADARRRHRWIRGDWQIAAWLLPWIPCRDLRRARNPVSGLSRWKIFDNLRRSLVPIALLALLLLGWCALPEHIGHFAVLELSIFGMVALPGCLSLINKAITKPYEMPVRMHLFSLTPTLFRQMGQIAFTLVLLPYEAFLSFHAILFTLGRLLLTRRGLLKWQPTKHAEAGPQSVFYVCRVMWIAPVVSLAMMAYLAALHPRGFYLSAPFLALWFVSPAIVWRLSLPIGPRPVRLGPEQWEFLHKEARKIWHFFETFVGPETHWLPPDNYQEHPAPIVAMRTSPTNIGLYLLANLASCDFGYISMGHFIRRTRETLATMSKLERYHGHFYNWYDIRTLQLLQPHYVSTVDSGNLAGHLLVLSPGLLERSERKIWGPHVFRGLRTHLRIVRELARKRVPKGSRWHSPPSAEILEQLEKLDGELLEAPLQLGRAWEFLGCLANATATIHASLESSPDGELKRWVQGFERACCDHRDDLEFMMPWLPLAASPEHVWYPVLSKEQLQELRKQWHQLDSNPTLRGVFEHSQQLLSWLDELLLQGDEGRVRLLMELRQAGHLAFERSSERMKSLQGLAEQCREFAAMDFRLLYVASRDLFSIGFNVSNHRLDSSHYDLLASEARLASFIAISQGQLKQNHWFSLGRLLTSSGVAPALISWSGSMFEYLMPLLVMPTYENTLLDASYKAAIERQIEYGRQWGVPWGFSESGCNLVDAHLNYQYRAFGVPGLGFKRGLADDLVVAPYASFLALMVRPEEACRNLDRLAREGREGPYGFYEAIDYTPPRLPPGRKSVTVQSYMAHHHGMSLLSLAYLLFDSPMQRRFEADPMFKASLVLLQERLPREAVMLYPHELEVSGLRVPIATESTMRVFTDPNQGSPEVHLLSNGKYHVMVTSAGGGYSRWQETFLTRWREDATRDPYGMFLYVRDLESGSYWSPSYQPVLSLAQKYEAIFSEGRAEFRGCHENIDFHIEICVSPEDDIELRRITLTNCSRESRSLEMTSFAEIVLNSMPAEMAHPVFNSLFIETQILRQEEAILCTRRRRSPQETPPWIFHLMLMEGERAGSVSYETNRLRFVGRGRTPVFPAAMDPSAELSNAEGAVLDPIVAIRSAARVGPGESAKFTFITGISNSKENTLALLNKYRDQTIGDRVLELAWTHGLVVLRHLNTTESDAQLYGRLASALLYANPRYRALPSILSSNRRGQRNLWSYGISGDLPILLLISTDLDRLDLVRQLLQAHSYWRLKGLAVDLVILTQESAIYRQTLYEQVLSLVSIGGQAMDRAGGIFVRRMDQLSNEEQILFQSVACVVLSDEAGTLAEQIELKAVVEPSISPVTHFRAPRSGTTEAVRMPKYDLIFSNGLGGFTRDGREYIITLKPGQTTPAPWVNVLANPQFGTVVSESGSAYTWGENSHQFRLTPWSNDPVSDIGGEAIYIRDEQSGYFWSPTPFPAGGTTPYVVHHGFGYSSFEHSENELSSNFYTYVSIENGIKFMVLRLRNHSRRIRQLSVTGYWEWVLGEARSRSAMHVVSEVDVQTGAILARNPYNSDFKKWVAFVDFDEIRRSMTGDRAEFLGRNGSPGNPAAMARDRLSGRVGAGLDPCAAVQVFFELNPGEEREIVFRLGFARSEDEARHLVRNFRGSRAARKALEAVWTYWNHTLSAVRVETPEPSLDILANGWLIYQTIASRLWARTGFYQSGGAFGFRDQLQDVLALMQVQAPLLREHLLRASAHQFSEGDVLHWWHPPTNQGVRTRFSDDYLWLPYVASRYVKEIGDTGVLDERIPFLEGRLLRPEEDAYYDRWQTSSESVTLYEHCVRAVRNGFKFGDHGLPLMGSGDWNDGMNGVGQHGKGESVWLAFFLYDVLNRFSELAQKRGDIAFAGQCRDQARSLKENIGKHAWDGQWYLRAYFDDGTPLGSASNPECQIDALPQSWAVLSNAGDPERVRLAMDSVYRRLARPDWKIIRLFDPPFDSSNLEPGYIKGYLPGVRENGGQYTHAAIWTALAYAWMGDDSKAWDLFSWINPICHGDTAEKISLYCVEPYVMAADVYAAPSHEGRGGWTWYTGSAGWMYQWILETILGLRLEVDRLRVNPHLPSHWNSLKVHYRFRETLYHIAYLRARVPEERGRILLDGNSQAPGIIPLFNDRKEHEVQIEF